MLKRYAIAQTRWQPDGWLAGSDVRVHQRNVTSQNRPGLSAFKSEAAIKSLGRPGDEASNTLVIASYSSMCDILRPESCLGND